MYILQQQFDAIEGQEASLRNVLITISNEMANYETCQMYMVTARAHQIKHYDLIAIFDDEHAYHSAMNEVKIKELWQHLPKYAIDPNPKIQIFGIVGGYFNLGTSEE